MEPSLTHSLGIQCRVIGALIMREIITRFGRHNIGFMWLFVEPMSFTLGITALWTMTKMTHGAHLPIVAFAVTGYSSVLMWRNSASRCSHAIEPNMSLLYHRNVRVFDIFMARLLLEIAGSTISLMVICGIFIALNMMAWPSDILTMTLGWLLLGLFAIGLGLTVGALSEMSEMFSRFWHTFTYLLFPLSGAVFMVEWLPYRMQKAVLYLPMVHGTEMLRHGYFGGVVRTHEAPAYLLLCGLVALLLGLGVTHMVGQRVEPQ